MSRRREQVQDLLRSEIGQLLLTKIKDPRVKLTNVTAVKVSPDLSHAVVWFSVLGTEDERSHALEALRHAKGFLRRELGKRLRLRVVPDLVLELDRGAEHSQRMSDLLESLHDHDAST